MSEIGRPMAGVRILVVDDERAIRRLLNTSLSAHGYTLIEAATGEEAITAVIMQKPDLIILDLGLPDMDGVVVARRLREWSAIPIIVLSVREYDTDKIAALDAGADDYLTKPFSMGELMARIRVALRHTASEATEPVVSTGELTIDLAHRVVMVADQRVQLTPTEYSILRALVTHAGKVLTHHQLVQQVWGPEANDDMHRLRVNISNLRGKLEKEPARPHYILTEPGVGYRLQMMP
jgi:two-component system KDP operon response regulator KdpE